MSDPSQKYVWFKSTSGLGDTIAQLEKAFAFCKFKGIDTLLIDLRNNPYLDDPLLNAFEEFFEPIKTRKPAIITNVHEIEIMTRGMGDVGVYDEGVWKSNEGELEKAQVNISKGKGLSPKLRLKKTVIKNLNKYKAIFFQQDKYIIGVHVRYGNNENGCGKLPNRLTKRNKNIIFNSIDNYLSRLNKLQKRVGIFICSDTKSFIQEFKSRYYNVIHIERFFLDDSSGASLDKEALNQKNRSDTLQKIDEYGRTRVGIEALTDMFLLKECDILFRTPSSFSDLAVNSGVLPINLTK